MTPQSPLEAQAWADLVLRIQADDPVGMEELYRIFASGIRFYLCRQLGSQDVDDKVHDVFLVIVQSVKRGDLREPERLMGYVRTVLRRHVASCIDDIVRSRNSHADLETGRTLADREPDPERAAIQSQNKNLALRVLNSLRQREREVLVRFYLKEQSPEDICRELDLTGNQFRLIKSRAKTRFVELAKRRFSLRRLLPVGVD
ncbi:MAG TPA: sigma-70 family RNA polymerase sigma factor [Candidatus Sulfopaludibacter sp.]|nr:sigma-70 family RNA polymerase sigma factor [Candidatus Sulfopaludibacter sp.]